MSDDIPPQIFAKSPEANVNYIELGSAYGIGIVEIGAAITSAALCLLIYIALQAMLYFGQSRFALPIYTHLMPCSLIIVEGAAVGLALAYLIRPVKSPITGEKSPGEQLTFLLAAFSASNLFFLCLRTVLQMLENDTGAPVADRLFRNSASIQTTISVSHEIIAVACFLIAMIAVQRQSWRLFNIANLVIICYWVFNTLQYFLYSFNALRDSQAMFWLGRGIFVSTFAAHIAAITLLCIAEKPASNEGTASLQRHWLGKALWIGYLLLSLATPLWYNLVSYFQFR